MEYYLFYRAAQRRLLLLASEKRGLPHSLAQLKAKIFRQRDDLQQLLGAEMIKEGLGRIMKRLERPVMMPMEEIAGAGKLTGKVATPETEEKSKQLVQVEPKGYPQVAMTKKQS